MNRIDKFSPTFLDVLLRVRLPHFRLKTIEYRKYNFVESVVGEGSRVCQPYSIVTPTYLFAKNDRGEENYKVLKRTVN